MGQFYDAVRDSVKSAVCSYLALDDNANSFFNRLSPIDLPNFGRFWRRKLCDQDSPPAQPPGSVNGGQCPCVLYEVTYIGFDNNNGTTFSGQRILNGPVSVDVSNPNAPRLLGGVPGQCNVENTGTFGGGNRTLLAVNAVRVDGQPDVCGNGGTPVTPFPDSGTSININVTYEDNSGTNRNLIGTLVLFAPVIGSFNRVSAPVTINLGGLDLNGTLELSPDFEFNFGDGSSPTPPGFGDEAPPVDDPDDAPTTPEDDDLRPLQGVIVRATPASGVVETSIFSDVGPTLYVPRLASLFFRIRTPAGDSWLGPIDVKTRDSFIPVPAGVLAVTAEAAFQPGWTGSVTLVYQDSRPAS